MSSSESSVLICVRNERVIYITLFVDERMIFAECIEDANKVISALKDCFEVKVGEADVLIGIQISRNRENEVYFLIKRLMPIIF